MTPQEAEKRLMDKIHKAANMSITSPNLGAAIFEAREAARDLRKACENVEPDIDSAPEGISNLTWSIGYAAGIDAMRAAILHDYERISKEGE